MKPITCITLLLICWGSNSLGKEINYLGYHQGIAQAELALVNEQFSNALSLYNKTFADYLFKFSADLYHAMQVAVLANASQDCSNLLDPCLAYGVPLHCLQKSPLIGPYLKTIPPLELGTKVTYYRQVYESKIDRNLLAEWRNRFQCEQKAKNVKDTFQTYLQCLKENYEAVWQYAKQGKPFPGEKIIGISLGFHHDTKAIEGVQKDSIWKEISGKDTIVHLVSYSVQEAEDEDCELSNDFLISTLLHTGITFIELKAYLDRSVANGTFHPRDYMYLCQFEQHSGKRQVGYLKYYKDQQTMTDHSALTPCFNMGWGPDACAMEIANANRAKIGICSVETDRRKKAIQTKYGFDFLHVLLY